MLNNVGNRREREREIDRGWLFIPQVVNEDHTRLDLGSLLPITSPYI